MRSVEVSLEKITLAYLYIPIVVFLIFWLRIFISIPIFLGYILVFVRNKRHKKNINMKIESESDKIDKIWVPFNILLFIFICIWCILSGMGGFVSQPSDWLKHNAIIHDLVENSWPVYYSYQGREGVMCYYIGFYLLPSLIGKLFGINAASYSMIIYSAFGVFLSCHWIANYIKGSKGFPHTNNKSIYRLLFIILACIILFGTFITPLSGVYRVLSGEVADGVHWFSNAVIIQFRSNICSMRWIPSQFIPALLTVSCVIANIDRWSKWGIYIAPLIMYSAFAFLGIVFIMITYAIIKTVESSRKVVLLTQIQDNARHLLSIGNLISLILIFVSAVYLSGTMLQYKPYEAHMVFGVNDFFNGNMVFLILFILSWFAWAILFTHRQEDKMILSSIILLFILTFISYGRWNDLSMNVSLPCLCVFTAALAKEIVIENDKKYRAVLWSLLLVCSIGAFYLDIYSPISNTGFLDEIERNKLTSQSVYSIFVDEKDNMFYQYICWDLKQIACKIIR